MIVKIIKNVFVLFLLFGSVFTANAQINLNMVKSHSFPNEEIPAELQTKLADLDKQTINYLKTKDFGALFKNLSSNLQNQGEGNMTKSLSPLADLISKSDTKQYYKSYIKFSSMGKGISAIPSETKFPFFMHIPNSNNETLVSLRVTCCSFTDRMFGFIYIKEHNNWKLAGINTSTYKIGGNDYESWYKKAIETKSKSLPVSAFLMMTIANQIKRPLDFIQYKLEGEIDDFTKELSKLANENIKLPVQYSAIKGNPIVFKITTQFVKNEMYIKVGFKTDSPFNKETLEIEAKQIHTRLSKMIPDLKQFRKFVVYTAFHEMPNERGKSYQNFTVVVYN